MDELKNKNKVIYIIVAVLILIGVIVCCTKGFNIELTYMPRQEFVVSNNTGLDVNKIEEIAKSVLGGKKVKAQEVERFGNAVQIISTEISDEAKQEIINKVNEEYGTEISSEDVTVTSIPATRIRDIIKPYIVPAIFTFVVVLVYFAFMYKKQGITKVLLKGAVVPLVTEFVFYSLIAITRIPFGRLTSAIAVGLYIASIGALTICFEKEKSKTVKSK